MLQFSLDLHTNSVSRVISTNCIANSPNSYNMCGRCTTMEKPQRFGGQPTIDYPVQNKTNKEQENQQIREPCSTITQPQDTAMDLVRLDLVRLRDLINAMTKVLPGHVINWVHDQSNDMKTKIWQRYLFYRERTYAPEPCIDMAIHDFREKEMWEIISDLQGLINDCNDHIPQKLRDWLLGLISYEQHDEIKEIYRKYIMWKNHRQLCAQKAIVNALKGRYILIIKEQMKKINTLHKLIKTMKYGPEYINYWNGASYSEKLVIYDRYMLYKGVRGIGPKKALKRALDEFSCHPQRMFPL